MFILNLIKDLFSFMWKSNLGPYFYIT
jgi:hypothetical protein